jgi:hypothetical protein
VQVLDVGLAEAGMAPGQVVQRGHSIIIASGAEIIPYARSITPLELLWRAAAGVRRALVPREPNLDGRARERVSVFSQAVQARHTLMSSEGYGTANFCFPAQMR